ncbi:MAG: putative tellurite resistance protein B-like protein [Planctomycetota bacterium]|jgi:uncharacterized tellurite resistance protein B-like protein
MKKILLKFLQVKREELSPVDLEHALRVATATLMVETIRADFIVQDVEIARLKQLLREQFQLDEDELTALLEQAVEGADKLISLQHITRLLNENFDHAMKLRVVEMLWQLIYADGEKDHYEEHLIRQVAELLYLSHAEFIQARHKAEE